MQELLRHSSLRSTLDVKTAQELLRHANGRITLDVYTGNELEQAKRNSSHSKNADERGERSGLLPPAWIVDEEARVWLTPILEYPDKTSVNEFCGNLLIGYKSQTDSLCRTANDEFEIVDDERPADRD
jgi:hypothetical protein